MISSRVPPQRKLSLIFGVLAVLVCVLVGAPANAQRDGRVTTADKGDSPRVKVLLDAKVDANSAPLYRVSFGQAAVEPAAAPKSSTRAATASAQGPTVVVDSLVGAVARGDMAVLRARLSSGANPNTSDDSKVKGWTPLMEAAYSGNVEATRLLLDAGAKIDAKNKFGATALDVAVLGGKTQVAEFLRSRGAKGTQGTQGIQANAQGDFINAASKGYLSLVKALLAAKADVNAKDYDGETALIAAAAQGHADVVKLLLDAGANKEAKDYWGNTALKEAKYYNHADVVKLLLDAGATK